MELPRSPDTVLRALKRLYNLGILPEWWKLEPMSAGEWRSIDALIAERDPYCRGVLVLGSNARAEHLSRDFREARASTTCRGFAAGHTIFLDPSRAWLAGEIDDAKFKQSVHERFESLIRVWHEARGTRHRVAQVEPQAKPGTVATLATSAPGLAVLDPGYERNGDGGL